MDNNIFMNEALKEALKAYKKDEVPVGAVIVKNNIIIGRGHNKREGKNDPTAHAEIIAIKSAAKNIKNWRLINCDLYVTLEPCTMCAGAIYLSRVKNVFIGALDPKQGAIISKDNVFDKKWLNHKVRYKIGIKSSLSKKILKRFFKKLRP